MLSKTWPAEPLQTCTTLLVSAEEVRCRPQRRREGFGGGGLGMCQHTVHRSRGTGTKHWHCTTSCKHCCGQNSVQCVFAARLQGAAINAQALALLESFLRQVPPP